MITFKYSLDRSSKKHTCPNCLQKRLVRYINIETNYYLEESVGRCDRESSCGYHKRPFANTTIEYSTPILSKTAPNKAISNICKNLFAKTLIKYDSNNLFKFLSIHFEKHDIINCFQLYKIGTSKKWNGATIYWQIDTNNEIKTGKIMLLDEISGKRIKEPFPHISWVHKELKLENFNLQQVLFGLHLINQFPDKNYIAIVESEKTAIIMNLILPQYIWLATGGKQNLKQSLLLPIKSKDITLFPDKTEFEDWNKISKQLQQNGFNIKCSNLIETKNICNGLDLADLLEVELTKKETKEISMFNSIAKDLNNKNNNLKKLINTFDLVDKYDDEFLF